MGRLIKDSGTWKWVAAALLGLALLSPLGNRIWDWPAVLAVIIGLLVLAVLLAWWRSSVERSERIRDRTAEVIRRDRERRERLQGEFDLYKPVDELVPSDFGFEYLEPGETADPDRDRPYYLTYVPRTMVPVDAAEAGRSAPAYSEKRIADELRAGHRVALHGPPTMGKSRTAYEITGQLRGWTVVRLKKTADAMPSPEAFAEWLTGTDAVLVIDDLNDFANLPIDWDALCGPDGLGQANTFAVLALCRDGSELGVSRRQRTAHSAVSTIISGSS